MGKGGIGVDVSEAEKREGHEALLKTSAAKAARENLKKALAEDEQKQKAARTKTKSAFSDLANANLTGDLAVLAGLGFLDAVP